MADALGDVLPLGVGVALSPIPIIAVVLMLVGRRARVNGPMFVLGWLVGLAVVGVIVLGIAGPSDASDDGDPATWVGVLKLLLGTLLLLVAARQWKARPGDGDETAMPRWMDAIDELTPGKALGTGALLSGLNPKNLLLAVAAGAAIAQTGIAGGEQAVVYAEFALIATTGVAVPVVISFALGDRAPGVLDRLKTSMARHNAAIMATLCLVIGVKLIGDGIAGL